MESIFFKYTISETEKKKDDEASQIILNATLGNKLHLVPENNSRYTKELMCRNCI